MTGLRMAYLCADRGVPVGGTKGASIHLRGVTEALSRLGHRVEIVAARVDAGVDPSARVHPAALDRSAKAVRRAVDAAGDEALGRELHGLLLNDALTRTLETLHAEEPFEALYERSSLWSFAGHRFAKQHRIPWILEVNAPLVQEQRTYRELSLEPVANGVQDVLLRDADFLVVPASELADWVRARVGREHGVAVLPNGVDLELWRKPPALAPEQTAALDGRFVVAFSGSLKPWHGVEKLLQAFETLLSWAPDVHLLVLGDGPLAPRVEELAGRLGPERVTRTGAVPHEQVPAWLARASVGVAPYPKLDDFYFSPLKIVEYLVAGLPVVASDLGQIRELVDPGETGVLVPPGDASALASALLHLRDDRRLRARMARRAAARGQRRHGWERVARRIEQLFVRRLAPSSVATPRERARWA